MTEDDAAGPPPRQSVVTPLRRQTVRRLVSAQFLAETGDGISLVALPLYVYARTDSELWTSLTFAAEMGFGAIGAVLGGVLADTFDRQRILLTSYLTRAVLLLLAFVIDPLLVAVGFGIIARAGGQADNPSFDALIPGQARGDLQQILALRRLIQGVSFTVGPAVGALIVAVIGPRAGLAVNAATFAVAFVILRTVTGLDEGANARRTEQLSKGVSGALSDLMRGTQTILRAPGMTLVVLYMAYVMATVGTLMASAVVWFERDLDVGGHWFGLSVAGFGIGTIFGLAWAGSRAFTWSLPKVLLVAAPIYTVTCGISAAIEQPWILPIGWLLWGVALGPEFVLSELFVVASVPEEGRGRAYASIGIATTIGQAIGYAVSGPLLEAFDARWVILGTSGAVLAQALIWLRPAITDEPHWRPASAS